MAWSQFDASTGSAALAVTGVLSGMPSIVSSSAPKFFLRDGVLARGETGRAQGDPTTVNASTATTTFTLASSTSAALYGTRAGRVVYEDHGRVYSWNARTAVATVVVDVRPNQLLQTGGTVYHTLGTSNALYRTTLR